MKGIRFYQEFRDARKRVPTGNVFARMLPDPEAECTCEDHPNPDCPAYVAALFRQHPEGFVPIYDWPNSAVAYSGASDEYLRKRCKRVSEAKAREIHPRLFERLDMED